MKNLFLIGFFLVTWNEFQLQTNSDCSKIKWTKECAQESIYDVVVSTNSVKLNSNKQVKDFKKMISQGSFNFKVIEFK